MALSYTSQDNQLQKVTVSSIIHIFRNSFNSLLFAQSWALLSDAWSIDIQKKGEIRNVQKHKVFTNFPLERLYLFRDVGYIQVDFRAPIFLLDVWKEVWNRRRGFQVVFGSRSTPATCTSSKVRLRTAKQTVGGEERVINEIWVNSTNTTNTYVDREHYLSFLASNFTFNFQSSSLGAIFLLSTENSSIL